MRLGCGLALATLVISSSILSADTYPRQPAVDAIHYRFSLTLSDDLTRLEGEAITTFRVASPIKEIELDLVSVNGGKGMTVRGVATGGHSMQYAHQSDRLRLSVPADAKLGQDVTYTITYGGTPADGLIAQPTLYGEPSLFSDNWPNRARHWLPMIDHPYDKATGELIVTAPAHYQVVSNGLLLEEVDLAGGQRRTHWKQSVPIASWLYALGVARFDVHHAGRVQGVPLQTWVFPQDRAAGRALFEETSRRAIDFFAQRIGPYPYEKLANVEASGGGGGMENATVIFYGDKGVASGRGPVVHEIAHQWFGNSVTERDWDDVWLSEGFATYFTHLYTEHYEGRDAFIDDLRRSRSSILQLERKQPDTPIVHRNLADMRRVLNQFVYQKGGWVLHMLRGEIGTDVFWRAIADYYRRYRDANASSDDLRQVMEHASGKDLRWFFSQWLTRAGVPRIEGTWNYDAVRKAVDVKLSQSEPPFRVTLEVGLVDAADKISTLERVTFDAREQRFTLPAGFVPAAVTVDPNTWLLADLAVLKRDR